MRKTHRFNLHRARNNLFRWHSCWLRCSFTDSLLSPLAPGIFRPPLCLSEAQVLIRSPISGDRSSGFSSYAASTDAQVGEAGFGEPFSCVNAHGP